ncbi:MAG: dihydrolipoyl dehydrogenase [Planctomycetes bacterium]|nr:dihydrolipoyl dehydrogenase [Planctomycetota bacterium]
MLLYATWPALRRQRRRRSVAPGRRPSLHSPATRSRQIRGRIAAGRFGRLPSPAPGTRRLRGTDVSDPSFDLIVIGSGPGGYVAGIRAAQLGLSTAVVEKDPHLGGTCLHRGCIPTKALLETAEVLDTCRGAAQYGVAAGEAKLDFAAAQKRKQSVVDRLARGIQGLFKKNKVTWIRGKGSLRGPGSVAVEDPEGKTTAYRAKHIILATGSTPTPIPVAPHDGVRIISSDQALALEHLPGSAIVLGAGAVGVEFASMWSAFGVKVTLVELLPRILPLEDDEVSAGLQKILSKKMRILTGARLTRAAAAPASVRADVTLADGGAETLEADLLLVAVGRRTNLDGLGLEKTRVKVDKGRVVIDPYGRTDEPTIFAIGDITQGPQLAHAASAEGIVAVEAIAGHETVPVDRARIPSCVYSHPEVASIGLTEKQAIEAGHAVKKGVFPFLGIGKALVLGTTDGFVKIVADARYGELLGVHMVGPRVTELLAGPVGALALEATAEAMERVIHPHPTLSEAIAEAVHATLGHAIHI